MWIRIIKAIVVVAMAVGTTKVSFDIMKKSGDKIEKEQKKK